MANRKKPEDKKKKKFAFSINKRLLSVLDEYLEKSDIPKRSRYIEKLIRADMGKRGLDISRDF